MKKKLASLLIVLSTLLLMIQGVQADFTDTADHPYEESILALQELGVLNGYEDGSFLPDNPVSRAELLKVVFAALDEEAAEFSGSCFYDVTGDWYGPYVCHAKSFGIVKGYDDGYFRPGQEVNLVEAFKIIQESFELDLRELEEGEHWYEAYVEFMHTNNLYSRYNSYPDRSATRGEVAFWVHQLLKVREGERSIQGERLPSYSAGCGLSAPETVPTSFTVDGEERSTISVVPDDYDPNESYALLIAFHGRTSDNEDVQGYYKVEEPSDGQAIIVYPAGTESNGSFSWKNSGDSASELRDYEFFDDIVEEFTSSYCINEDEIYAIGHSLGAWFTNSLACARGDVLRGVASLG